LPEIVELAVTANNGGLLELVTIAPQMIKSSNG
jgi:hypothetical protein